MEKGNTIKFTVEMSETEVTFLGKKVYKGIRFNKEPILDVQTLYKTNHEPMSQQKPFRYSCHPPGVKKCFIKGEALRSDV